MKGRKSHNRAAGGKAPQLIAGNSDVVTAAKEKTGGFNKGGKVKRASGGKIVGLMTGGPAPSHQGKARRLGGSVGKPGPRPGRAMGGPLSSAHKVVGAPD